jgi:hypothetical protein
MRVLTSFLAAACVSAVASANVQLGQAAPDFTLTDVNGKAVKLADFKGKHVVLEWTNPSCPFVVKHYGSKNMPNMQTAYGSKGVVWLSINSTAKGHPEFLDGPALDKRMGAWGHKPTSLLLDPEGAVGKAYGAKTTPHMYIVDPKGSLIYAGGIDDKRSANPADIPGAKNFVKAALDEALAGKPVSVASSQPYGCSVKYQ